MFYFCCSTRFSLWFLPLFPWIFSFLLLFFPLLLVLHFLTKGGGRFREFYLRDLSSFLWDFYTGNLGIPFTVLKIFFLPILFTGQVTFLFPFPGKVEGVMSFFSTSSSPPVSFVRTVKSPIALIPSSSVPSTRNQVISSVTLAKTTKTQYKSVISCFLRANPAPSRGFKVSEVYLYFQSRFEKGYTHLAKQFSLAVLYLLEEGLLVTSGTDVNLLLQRFVASLRRTERNRDSLQAQPLLIMKLASLPNILTLYVKFLIVVGARWATLLKQPGDPGPTFTLLGQLCKVYIFQSPDTKNFVESRAVVTCDCTISGLKGASFFCLVHAKSFFPLDMRLLNLLRKTISVSTYFSRRSATILAAAILRNFSLPVTLFNGHFGWPKKSLQIEHYARDWPKHTDLVLLAGPCYGKLAWVYAVLQGIKVPKNMVDTVSRLEQQFSGLWDTQKFGLTHWDDANFIYKPCLEGGEEFPSFSLLPAGAEVSEAANTVLYSNSFLPCNEKALDSNPTFTREFFAKNIVSNLVQVKTVKPEIQPKLPLASTDPLWVKKGAVPSWDAFLDTITLRPSKKEAFSLKIPFWSNTSEGLPFFFLGSYDALTPSKDTLKPVEVSRGFLLKYAYNPLNYLWVERLEMLKKIRLLQRGARKNSKKVKKTRK